MEAAARAPRRKRRIRKEIKWALSAFVLILVLEYLVLPELGGVRKSLHQVDHINLAYVFAGVLLEALALIAYAQLTYTVLPDGGPKRSKVLQIDLSSLAVSHVVPGGTAPGAALSYRLFTQEGVRGADAGFAIAMQGVGSAVVLNVIFWVALLISLFLRGYNPLYAVAAGAGVLLMGTFATVVILLTRGQHKAADTVRRLADRVPFLDGDQLGDAVQRVADRLQILAVQRDLLRRAIAWAAANWLLDAASLWVSIAAFGKITSPIYVLVAYGLANILAVIPVTPSGLGVVEGVLAPTLAGFGVANPLLPVLLYRLWNFWLPIPVGGAAYASLRFSGQGWRQRLRNVRNEVVETEHQARQGMTEPADVTAAKTGRPAGVPAAPDAVGATAGASAGGSSDVGTPRGGRSSQRSSSERSSNDRASHDRASSGRASNGVAADDTSTTPVEQTLFPLDDDTAVPLDDADGAPTEPQLPLEDAHRSDEPQRPSDGAGNDPGVSREEPAPAPRGGVERGRGRGPAGAPAH